MIGKNIVVFDTEIKATIDGSNVKWTDFNKMGISVACLYDYLTDDYLVFMDDNLEGLCERLLRADLVVGFNILGFDLPLVHNTAKTKMEKLKCYDILEKSRMACGWEPGRSYSKYPGGLKLDDHLLGTFGKEHVKTDHGANAPLHWQAGKLGQLISYCLADVKREKKLFDHIVEHGWVETPTHGRKEIARPAL